MTNHVLRQALDYAGRGWPVFPCQPGKKIPATPHGYLDATTDQGQVYAWFGRDPQLNLAVATGAPASTSWTSTSTAKPETASRPWPSLSPRGCSTA